MSLSLVCCGRKGPRPALDLSCMRKSIVDLGSALEVDGGFPGLFGNARSFESEFTLCEALGSGSTSVVKRAIAVSSHTSSDVLHEHDQAREVAVKCVSSGDEEPHYFMLEEYRLLQSLQHPNIVRVEALFTNSFYSLMVMELCERSLASHVQGSGPLQQSEAISLFQQLLMAVAYLHEKRIVHRDVKPANLLLHGRALKLSDFNSAKCIGTADDQMKMLSVRGTLHFCAPEVLAGRLWNERIDIWACGVSLYYMLRGKLPFNCTRDRIKELLVAGQLPEVAWDGVDPLARHLIQQCLSVEMRDRPATLELLQHQIFARLHPVRRTSLSCPTPRNLMQLVSEEKLQRKWSDPIARWNDGSPTGVRVSGDEVFRQLQMSKLARATQLSDTTADDSLPELSNALASGVSPKGRAFN